MTDKPRVERPDEEIDPSLVDHEPLYRWGKQWCRFALQLEADLKAHPPAEARADRQDGWDAAIQAAGLAIAARAKNWECLPAEMRHILNLLSEEIRTLKMPEDVPK